MLVGGRNAGTFLGTIAARISRRKTTALPVRLMRMM